VRRHQGSIKVKEEPGADNVIVLSDNNDNQLESGSRWTNANLPPGCQRDNAWRRIYVTTFAGFVAGYRDPWIVNDEDAIKAMQKIWDKCFLNNSHPDIHHRVTLNDPVFSVVSMAVL
jgi:hypothetical protein